MRRTIDAVLIRFAGRGECTEALAAQVVKRFEEHEPYLWVKAPGLKVITRSTVDLERAHREGRQGVRHRRGQADTQPEMVLLAFWSNARCPWLLDRVLKKVNLWDAFPRQDHGEVRRRTLALPKEGERPRVLWHRIDRTEQWAGELLRLLQGQGPVGTGVERWKGHVKGDLAVAGL